MFNFILPSRNTSFSTFCTSTTNMHFSTLTLLISLSQILSMGTAAPLSVEVVKMKVKVRGMAKQLVVKLTKDLQVIFVVVSVVTVCW